jgi:hypothetical protein
MYKVQNPSNSERGNSVCQLNSAQLSRRLLVTRYSWWGRGLPQLLEAQFQCSMVSHSSNSPQTASRSSVPDLTEGEEWRDNSGRTNHLNLARARLRHSNPRAMCRTCVFPYIAISQCGNATHSFSGGIPFESRPQTTIPILPILSTQMFDQYVKTSLDHFPHPFQYSPPSGRSALHSRSL